jgi:hypothetical protein
MRQAILVAVCMALAGCSLEDPRICSTPPAIQTPGVDNTDLGNADGCVHRWAYRLARSKEAPDQVAEAVLGACHEPISRYIRSIAERSSDADRVYRSPLTNRETTFAADEFAQRRLEAKFHVVQARAGRCKVP